MAYQMDHSLKTALLNCLVNSKDDDAFIAQIEVLSASAGTRIFGAVFHLLAGIDIPDEQGANHWQKLLRHRAGLGEALGRPIGLVTALCDYLQTTTGLVDHPRLVETAHYEDTLRETIHDPLTGLLNRLNFDEVYRRQVSLARRYRNDFAVLFLDIDDFKAINDRYGHPAGDAVLKQIASVIIRRKRKSDIAVRYGGEEFVLLLMHTDNITGYIVAERIRREAERQIIRHRDQRLRVTVSGGIASFPFNTKDPARLLEMADSAVYLAKGAGKNRICHFKKEKRRYLRVAFEKQVQVRGLDFHSSRTFSGTSKDISIGGMLFETAQVLAPDELIAVQVALSGRAPLVLVGKVARVKVHRHGGCQVGMTTSFREMDQLAIRQIGNLLPRRSGQ